MSKSKNTRYNKRNRKTMKKMRGGMGENVVAGKLYKIKPGPATYPYPIPGQNTYYGMLNNESPNSPNSSNSPNSYNMFIKNEYGDQLNKKGKDISKNNDKDVYTVDFPKDAWNFTSITPNKKNSNKKNEHFGFDEDPNSFGFKNN
jgi:hypothetical protein